MAYKKAEQPAGIGAMEPKKDDSMLVHELHALKPSVRSLDLSTALGREIAAKAQSEVSLFKRDGERAFLRA